MFICRSKKGKELTIKELVQPLDTQLLDSYIQDYLVNNASTLKMLIESCMLFAPSDANSENRQENALLSVPEKNWLPHGSQQNHLITERMQS